MTASGDSNPYQSSHTAHDRGARKPIGRRMVAGALIAACFYHAASALTLPFAGELWLGELPVLAIIQLPKALLKDFVQDGMIWFIRWLGLGSGSPSPDSIATHPWALGLTLALPSVVLLAAISLVRQLNAHKTWMVALVISAVIDAAVTTWFDLTSRLSIF